MRCRKGALPPRPAVFLSSHYRLLPDAVVADFSLSYAGAFDHPARVQEVPAFFADRRLSVLALYTGDEPWGGGDLTFLMPGGVNEVGGPPRAGGRRRWQQIGTLKGG